MIIVSSLQIHFISITSFTTSRAHTIGVFLLQFLLFEVLEIPLWTKLLHRPLRFLIFLNLFNLSHFISDKDKLYIFDYLCREYFLKMTHQLISIDIQDRKIFQEPLLRTAFLLKISEYWCNFFSPKLPKITNELLTTFLSICAAESDHRRSNIKFRSDPINLSLIGQGSSQKILPISLLQNIENDSIGSSYSKAIILHKRKVSDEPVL